MQVVNSENFIFETRTMKFGGLYKSEQTKKCFLNTFTPCFSKETALQFEVYNALFWALNGTKHDFFGNCPR